MWFSGVDKDKNKERECVLGVRCAESDQTDVEKQNFRIC
jgi:hypothetical protein